MNIDFIKENLALYSRRSDDPDTKTACIVLNPGGGLLGAANEMPEGVVRTLPRLSRPAKYTFIGHAERTLIARAAKIGFRLQGCTMHLNWFPCSDCALAIAESGIRILYCDEAAYAARKDDPRYKFSEAMDILREAGVIVRWM
jgi:dCMP deaminase